MPTPALTIVSQSRIATMSGLITLSPDGTVTDTQLAKDLRCENPHAVRRLVKRNARWLEHMGPLHQSHLRVIDAAHGEKRTTQYRLSIPQAVFIAARVDTPDAQSFSVMMAEILSLYLRGGLVWKPA